MLFEVLAKNNGHVGHEVCGIYTSSGIDGDVSSSAQRRDEVDPKPVNNRQGNHWDKAKSTNTGTYE
jgi:hypothetical protein